MPWDACHIDQRLDPENYIGLNSAAADNFLRGLIDDNGHLVVSPDFDEGSFHYNLERISHSIPKPSKSQIEYLQSHRELIFGDWH